MNHPDKSKGVRLVTDVPKTVGPDDLSRMTHEALQRAYIRLAGAYYEKVARVRELEEVALNLQAGVRELEKRLDDLAALEDGTLDA